MNKSNDHTNTNEEFDQLLLQWMDGELDGQSLSDFMADPRFEAYQMIADATSKMDIPTLNEEAILSKIKGQINQKRQKAKTIALWKKLSGVAAVLIAVVTAVSLLTSGVSVDSYQAIQRSHALPDGSQVILNSDSELSYGDNFEEQRILKLEGEAFFEVEKGKTFTVSTDVGDVTVLGTSFNVIARDDIFSVSCKTGKVQVNVNGKTNVLTSGERIRYHHNQSTPKENIDPSKINQWANGESYFERTPLSDVIVAMSHKYDIAIVLPLRHQERLFTGSFIHHDIGKAMKMVLVPMGIEYEIGEEILIK